MLSPEQLSFYNQEGYVIVPNVFSESEVEVLRKACEENTPVRSVLGLPVFTEILLDERIIKPMKQILGPDVLHFGEASSRFDDKVTDSYSRHFHTDSRYDDYDFSKTYPVVRAGIYLQDHAKHSGGLKLRPRSFRRLCLEQVGFRGAMKHLKKTKNPLELCMGRSLNVPSRSGDLLIWFLRTHHSGYAVRLRGLPSVSLHPIVENWIPNWAQINEEKKRCAIFASFGAPSKYFELYLKQRVEQDYMQEFWANSTFDREEIRTLARRAGVTLRCDGIEYVQRQK